ncbi:SDR family NAD(P)-dependent oxidoreductase [Paenibacillus mesophilus]|uniref:SDR family NAD(P)-dependent oxidoreductase n=1 Tax=Paenibacillus mesophilus TaxID=2582849 RepID=UPI00192E48C8|nr:SDR family NAD(P)-dependent oxidoreductase [Paenibacillus mesophilus]
MRSTELFDLRGKVAFVTGGYGMFGRLISEALLEAGAGVVIAARDTGKAIGAADEMANRGLMADVIRLDLADPDSIRSTIQAIIAQYGRIDILVNNAVARQGSTLEETTIEDWEATQAQGGGEYYQYRLHSGRNRAFLSYLRRYGEEQSITLYF